MIKNVFISCWYTRQSERKATQNTSTVTIIISRNNKSNKNTEQTRAFIMYHSFLYEKPLCATNNEWFKIIRMNNSNNKKHTRWHSEDWNSEMNKKKEREKYYINKSEINIEKPTRNNKMKIWIENKKLLWRCDLFFCALIST